MAPSRSGLWSHYTYDNDRARCDRCGVMIMRSSNSNNLWTHLKSKHRFEVTYPDADTIVFAPRRDAEQGEINDPASVPSTSSGTSRSPVEPPTKSQGLAEIKPRGDENSRGNDRIGETNTVQITDAFHMVVEDSLPYRTPQKEIEKFSKVCVPLWKSTSRRIMTRRTLHAKYELMLRDEISKMNLVNI